MHASRHYTDIADSEPVGWGMRLLLLALWALAGFGTMYVARDLEQIEIMHWPLAYWLAAQGIIVVYVALVALYAWTANRRESRQRGRGAMPDGAPAVRSERSGDSRDVVATALPEQERP